MHLPNTLQPWLDAHGWGAITRTRPVAGGCINSALLIETTHGPPALLKHNPSAPTDMFARESEGLAALANADGGPRVPAVFAVHATWLLIEYLSAAPRQPGFDARLGEQLAALHRATSERFGFAHDNYIGSTPQPNAWHADGCAFFAEQRLGYQVSLARSSGLLTRHEAGLIERVAARLPELVPAQPPSLIHGDLWSGNLIVGPEGEPALIDPAAHYGWAEAELAMTTLFGRFSAATYAAYLANSPVTDDWASRADLYNLYHLLNHLNLFGGGYHGSVVAIARRYG